MLSSLKVCTLLYIDGESNVGLPNNKSGNIISSYVYQCVTLNRSLLASGMQALNIYTNQMKLAREIYETKANLTINFINLENDVKWVPEDIGFSQAHHKIDLLRQLNKTLKTGEYFLLLDSDILCLKAFDTTLLKPGCGLVYDITDQCVPAYGYGRIRSDLELLSDIDIPNPRWYGGEFLCGDRIFLSRLLEEIDITLPRYVSYYKKIHHHGDEAIVSSALNRMQADSFMNIAPLNVVNRYWSVHTKHLQHPFRYAARTTFLHLPSEKKFLEKLADGHKEISKACIRTLGVRCFMKRIRSNIKYSAKRMTVRSIH